MQDKIKRLESLISNLEKYTDKVKGELSELRETDNLTQCHKTLMDKRMPIDKFFSNDNLDFEYLVELKEDVLTPGSLLGDKIDKGMYFVRSYWKHVKCLQFFYAHNKKWGVVSQIEEIGYDVDSVYRRLDFFTGEYKGKEYKNGVEVEKKKRPADKLFSKFTSLEDMGNAFNNAKDEGETKEPLWYTGNDNWKKYLTEVYKNEFKRPLSLLNSISFTIEGENTRVYSLNGKILNGWFNGKFYKDGKEI